MKRPTTITALALVLLLRLAPANAQLVEAECPTSWPFMPFPEGMVLDYAHSKGFDIAWKQFSAPDSVRAGQPPAPRIARKLIPTIRPPPSTPAGAATSRATRPAIAAIARQARRALR